MLWTIIVILVILWLLGVVINIGGAFIHILIVAAIIIFIYNLITRNRNKSA